MADIRSLVTNLPWEPHHKKRLEEAAPEAKIEYVELRDQETLQSKMADAQVAVVLGRPDLSNAKKLEWLHMDAAGLDSIAQEDYINAGFPITGSAGRSDPAMAEHIFYFMLNLAYHTRTVLAAQDAHRWGYPGQAEMKALYEQTLGIVGLGHTGVELARRAKAFGMKVLVYNRSQKDCAFVDRLYTEEAGETPDEMLRSCDFLAMACALTDKTYHMIGREQLAMMKPSAFVINLGRGKTIDESALLEALNNGTIAGAGLDTFETEPLPQNSPVWSTPNLYATPHFTPACPDKLGRSLDVVIENIHRFHEGQPLVNVLKKDDIFHKR